MTKDDTAHGKLQWHPAFLQAIQMELIDYRDYLEFKYEYQLTSGPLCIDLLIIKKPKDIVIQKNIARIFRADNLLEYKSPEDYLSIKDFLKVYAYANLYAAITPGVELSDLTLTFVESRHPRTLLRYLTGIRGYTVEETSPGIYRVLGDYIPIQIIESKKLSKGENLWLKSLRNDLEIRGMNAILEQGKKQGPEAPLDAYIDVILRANEKTYMEVNKMWQETVVEFFKEKGMLEELKERAVEQYIEEKREEAKEEGLEEGREKGKEIMARNLLRMGMSVEEIAQAAELPIEKIRSFENGK
jgi:hypothetical protein